MLDANCLVYFAFLIATAAADADATADQMAGNCGYIFDFDNTITQHIGGELATDVQEVVEGIRERGMPIGIATASCSDDIPDILQSQVNAEVFNETFFESPAFQTCNVLKNEELQAIVSYYNLDPQCTVFFDDSVFNKAFALVVDVIFKQVEFGVGITLDDFADANATLHRDCNCANIIPWTAPEQGADAPSSAPPANATSPVQSADAPSPGQPADAAAPEQAVNVPTTSMSRLAAVVDILLLSSFVVFCTSFVV